VRNLLFAVFLAVAIVGCDTEPPDECIQLCNRIEAWTQACKAPSLSAKTCANKFTYDRRSTGRSSLAIECWSKLMEWTPNLAAEFDCTQPPPGL
jgi:hypothetical protein